MDSQRYTIRLMSNAARASAYTETEIYALEDAEWLCSGPLPDDSEEDPEALPLAA
jgi:hypothetical protein